MATKTKKHQNNISDDEFVSSLIKGDNPVSAGVLDSTYGNYAKI